MKLLTEAETLEQSVLKLKTMDWPILMSHDTVGLEILTATLRSQVDDRKGKVFLAHQIEKSNVLPHVRNSYLTLVISPRCTLRSSVLF